MQPISRLEQDSRLDGLVSARQRIVPGQAVADVKADVEEIKETVHR
jgi:hypothetical protein